MRWKHELAASRFLRIAAISIALFMLGLMCGIAPTSASDQQSGSILSPRQAYADGYTGWDYSGGYWYYYENGVMLTNSWVMDSTDWAYVGSDGRAYQSMWAYLPDSSGTFWYYFNGDAHIVRNCWAPDSTSWGYLDGDGHAVTGWNTISFNRYYFDPSSASMQTGWLTLGSNQYYLRTTYNEYAPGPDGAMLESGLWYIDGAKRWFRADGTYDPNFNGHFPPEDALTSTSYRNLVSTTWQWHSDGSVDQNCLAFALDSGNCWTWPWGGSNPTVYAAEFYMEDQGYTIHNVSAPLSYPYIIAYAKNGYVTHFARVNATGNTYAKWGHSEIFKHGSYDPYTNYEYGSAVFCAK